METGSTQREKYVRKGVGLKKVVGIAPDGSRVLFECAADAAAKLGLSIKSIYRSKCAGISMKAWHFEEYKKHSRDTFVPLTEELKATCARVKMEQYGDKPLTEHDYYEPLDYSDPDKISRREMSMKRYNAITRAVNKVLNPNGVFVPHQEDDIEPVANYPRNLPKCFDLYGENSHNIGKEAAAEKKYADKLRRIRALPHTWGYFVNGCAFAILPVSQRVIPNGDNKAYEKVKAELVGRDWVEDLEHRILVVKQ